MHTCLWNESPQLPETVVFPEFSHNFFDIKTRKSDLKLLLFKYWKDFFLGVVETYFLEVGGLWNKPSQISKRIAFAEFEWKYHNFLEMKTGECDLKLLLFN